MKTKYIILIILVFVVLVVGSPLLVNWVINSNALFGMHFIEDNQSWLSFYGNFVGAIVGAIISVLIALAVIDNERNNRKYDEKLSFLIKFTEEHKKIDEILSQISNKLNDAYKILFKRKAEPYSYSFCSEKITEIFEAHQKLSDHTLDFIFTRLLAKRLLNNEQLKRYDKQYDMVMKQIKKATDELFIKQLDFRGEYVGEEISMEQKDKLLSDLKAVVSQLNREILGFNKIAIEITDDVDKKL